MTLPELSIRRFVLAFMLSAVLVLFGVISYQRLGVDRFPYIEFPVISVTTTMPGSNPEIIDSSITSVVESAVNSVPGIDHIQSTSAPAASVITITFNLDKDINIAFNEVQSKVNQIIRRLPDEAEPPVVSKMETEASPIIWLSLQGDRTLQQLNQYARNVVRKRLETIDGVGDVRIGGRRDRTIRLRLDPARMAAQGITTQDLIRAFNAEHVQLPGGFLVGNQREELIKLDMEFHRLDELRQMILAFNDGSPIHLSDVADVEDGLEDYRQFARFNGKPSVGLGIVKIPNTNTVAIVEEVKRRLEADILPQLPPGMTLRVASDNSTVIVDMVFALKEHLLLATLLASIVVLLFLQSIRSTVIIATAIPVSLMGSIAVMYFSGFTFNTLTLLALLLLVGVVVDDAIVVLENIYRHREHIEPDSVRAAVLGSKQVVFAVIASSLTLVSIFAPVIFMGGIIGKFFQSFSVVVTFGVLVSLFVSLTLTPMLCSRYLKVASQHGRLYQLFHRAFLSLDRLYRRLLELALGHRWKVVATTLLIVSSSVYFFGEIGKTFVPEEDESRFMIFFKAPLGSSIEYTDSRLKKIEAVLDRHQEIYGYFTAVGLRSVGQVNEGIAFVRMVPRSQRSLSQQDLIAQVRKELFGIPGVKAFAAPVPMVSGMRGEALQFAVTGPNAGEVARLSNLLLNKLSAVPDLGKIDIDLQVDLPQEQVIVDRTRAASLGLTTREIAQAVNVMIGGLDVAKFNDEPGDGERYDIRMKAEPSPGRPSVDMTQLYLRTREGQMIRLDALARMKPIISAAVISRYDLRYAANFFGSPTIPLADAVRKVTENATGLLPMGYRIQWMGQAEEFGKTADYMAFTFVLALILVYMVLASQFNSFVQPLIVMLAQPLAIIGGLIALWVTGQTLNIYSMIGMVLLIGLVAKNSILLVDLTNQFRAEGRDISTALKEACPIRMRPVVMTSMTIIFALLPVGLGLGAGADTNGPLAITVIGGMISSTLLTLVVVPVVYSLVENGLARRRCL